MSNIGQINPIDMTGYFQLNSTVLRTGLLSVRGILAPLVAFPLEKEGVMEKVREALEKIDQVLVEHREVEDLQGLNK